MAEVKRNKRKKHKNDNVVLTAEEISHIPLIGWSFKGAGKQQQLLLHSWNTNTHSTVYELLKVCNQKGNKIWINNLRRALHTFKPPDYDSSVWCKFHELFKENVDDKQYESASVIILPMIASICSQDNSCESLEKSYKILKSTTENIAQKDKDYKGPPLRSIAALLQICVENINKGYDKPKNIEIALNLYKLSLDYKVDLTLSASRAYFDYLFQIFAFNKTCIQDFNVLFHILTQNDHNKILMESTSNALKMFFKTIDNIEIYENMVSDLNGYLFHDEAKQNKLKDIKLPRFRLSVLENSEIWNQLRLTQMNDEANLKYERKQLLINKTRMQKLGMKQSAEQFAIFDEEDENNYRRKKKYEQFIKYMLKDGGAEVIIDGANVGHMIKQQCFCFDFIDHVASYYANTKKKKVRIIMTMYRVINAESCNNDRVNRIVQKWIDNKWLIKVPNILYDDVLWSIYTLHSCLIYDGKVMIVTNDDMKDHQNAVDTAVGLNQKRLFEEFLETKLCRIEIFKTQNRLCYDPFDENTSNSNGLKRHHDFEDEGAIKKQKVDNDESIIQRIFNEHQNFHSKYEYIHSVFPYKMHEPYSYVIKPQFYQYQIQDGAVNTNNSDNKQKWEELMWFLPHISNTSDCQNPLNMMKQSYSDWIIQKRIRWVVARVRRPIL